MKSELIKFVKRPNLPERKINLAAVSNYKPDFADELKNNYGIYTISEFEIESISGSEKFHADMCISHVGDNNFFVYSGCNGAAEKLKDRGGNVILCDNITSKNPLLNVCIIKNKMICNIKKTNKSLLDFCLKNNIAVFHTNQGYSKCSAAIINDNSVITSDESIFKVCNDNKIDVLKIRSGYIQLDGYQYGFIGGTCGLISRNELVFSGNIKLHPDYENIKSFCRNYDVSIISLSSQPLYDIGGILPITEI